MMTSRIERERFEFAMHGIHVEDVSYYGDAMQHMYHGFARWDNMRNSMAGRRNDALSAVRIASIWMAPGQDIGPVHHRGVMKNATNPPRCTTVRRSPPWAK